MSKRVVAGSLLVCAIAAAVISGCEKKPEASKPPAAPAQTDKK